MIGRALERSAMPAGPPTPVDSNTSEQHQLKYQGAPARALNSGIEPDPHTHTRAMKNRTKQIRRPQRSAEQA